MSIIAEPSIEPDPIPLETDPNAWMRYAACRDSDEMPHERFFPDKGDSTVEVRAFCRERCDVRSDCLLYAIEGGHRSGIWGGMGERARRRVKHLLESGMGLAEAMNQAEPRSRHRKGKGAGF